MPLNKAEFSGDDVEVLQQETLFQGFSRLLRTKLKHRLFGGGWSAPIERELFDRGDACAAILYDPTNDLIALVEQFRIGALKSEYGPWCLEVVAGLVDAGETAEQVIRREIAEEAGITEVDVSFITSFYSTPGACNEKVSLYCGLTDLSQAGGLHGLDQENEDIRLHIIPAEQVFAAMLSSRVNNATTIVGLLWLQQNRDGLRQTASHHA